MSETDKLEARIAALELQQAYLQRAVTALLELAHYQRTAGRETGRIFDDQLFTFWRASRDEKVN